MEKIEGKKVLFKLDDYTFEIERLLKVQCSERMEPAPNRSEILRKLYRAYISERLIVKE